jgi:hypothetical protein
MRWRPFPKYEPKEEGWYQVTIEISPGNVLSRYVGRLYWRASGVWWDNIRQNMQDLYEVRSRFSDHPLVHVNCNRTCYVVAWKKPPHTYKK